MRTPMTFPLDTHLELVNGGSVDRFHHARMIMFICSCWFFIQKCLFYAFGFLTRYLFRFLIKNSFQKDESTRIKDDVSGSSANTSGRIESVPEVIDLKESDYDGFEEKEASSSSTESHLNSSEHSGERAEEMENSADEGTTLVTNIRKYSFLSEKNLVGFIEGPQVMNFSIEESYVCSKSDDFTIQETPKTEFEDGFLLENDFHLLNSGIEAVHEKPSSDMPNSREEEYEKSESVTLSEDHLSPRETFINDIDTSLGDKDKLDQVEFEFCKDNNPSGLSHEEFSVDNQNNNSKRYDFLSEKEFSGFEFEPETEQKSEVAHLEDSGIKDVETLDLDLGDSAPSKIEEESANVSEEFSVDDQNRETKNYDFLSAKDFSGFEFEPETEQKTEATHLEDSGLKEVESLGISDLSPSKNENQTDSLKLYTPNTESTNFGEGSSSAMHEIDYSVLLSNEFLSEKDFYDQKHNLEDFDEEDAELQKFEEVLSPKCRLPYLEEFIDLDSGTSSIEEELNDTEQSEDFLYHHEFRFLNWRETEPIDELQTTHLENPLDSSSDDSNLWEHDDLIEQLKMELKRVRGFGLPTILEESESPTSSEDLKPWKIEETLLPEDPMDEIQKFYTSYREKMRKLDTLNYQDMYAIGFLELKDHLQSSGRKNVSPAITSLLSQNLCLWRSRKAETDPTSKLVKELQCDMETVYLGQACLSWEMLHWQYLRSRDLPESDERGVRHYNQVAGEFQQLQVLLQRFVENEAFEGPRVQNYVKNRCVLRNLLQVPPIKEDCFKDKMEERRRGSHVITISMLAEIMEESMRVFWEFIRADKDESHVILKGFLSTQVELQDPQDSQLLANIQADLQKKEKKLKDLLRTGNCIVKKFQKHQEGRLDQTLFLAQVDLKLVSRVLKMTRITSDQLLWCQKKLNKITFRNRKLYRESSFLLFPC